MTWLKRLIHHTDSPKKEVFKTSNQSFLGSYFILRLVLENPLYVYRNKFHHKPFLSRFSKLTGENYSFIDIFIISSKEGLDKKMIDNLR